ncbi:MAG: DUF2520 domain-containing protein [Ignavibacteria bacterium]
MKITIIGAGRVGSAFAIELFNRGYKIQAVIDKSKAKASRLAKFVYCKTSTDELTQEIAENSDIILLAIKDDDLLTYYREVKHIDFRKRVLVHSSGVLTSELFKKYNAYKRDCASLHPAQTFPKVSIKNNHYLKGIYFGIEGGDRALSILKNLTKKLGSNNIILKKNNKSMYHLGCVISSNFLIANFYILKEFSSALGISEKRFFNVLKPLYLRTAQNLHEQGVLGSLTGPIVREDVITIKAHLKLLHRKYPKFVEYYRTASKILAEVSTRQNKNFNKKLLSEILNE